MNCVEFEDRLNAYFDGEVDDRPAVEKHLAACASCRQLLDSLRTQDRALSEAFAPYRDRDFVAPVLAALPRSRSRWYFVPVAAAAGFFAAYLFFRTPSRVWQLEEQVRTLASELEKRTSKSTATGLARLELSTGAVEIQEGNADWVPLATGGAIEAGSRVRTLGQAKCSFRCEDGTEVRLNRDTEMCFQTSRRVELKRGQMYTAIVPQPERFRVATEQTTIEALGTTLDIRHVVRTAESEEKKEGGRRITTLTVLDGTAQMGDRLVPSGYVCQISDGSMSEPSRVHELAIVTRWVHELLFLQGRDSQELEKRVNAMLAMLGRTKMEELYESEIRSMGDHCALPLTRYLQSEDSRPDPNRRRKAARILADIASPPSVPDLIALLEDEDAEVRVQMARGLHRLTGETMGVSDNQWTSGREGCRAWREWLGRNQETWGAPKRK